VVWFCLETAYTRASNLLSWVALWALGFVRASMRARNEGCGSGSSLTTFTCAYHPKTKIPTLNCITDSKTQKIQIAAPSTFTHQPSNKGRKRIIFHNAKPPCSTAAYHFNLNTSQQELLRLHNTYSYADMP
jgi:hypothetical protein